MRGNLQIRISDYNIYYLPGEIITFDQLALRAPIGQNTMLIQGNNIHNLVIIDDEKLNLDERNDFQKL